MHKIFEFLAEAFGWLMIVASPFLIGLIIGAVIYFSDPTEVRLIAGISFAAIGLIVGILWATKIWRSKRGTIGFLSRIMATPELDNEENNVSQNIDK